MRWILAAALGAFTALPGHSQDIEIGDLKAATDGRCDYWLEMLRENPTETVEFNGTDKNKTKVKVLSDGKRWRIVLLAGAKKPLFACTIMDGDGAIAP